MLRSDHSAFSSGSPFARWAWLALSLVVGSLALGCTPKIGDECTVSTNCSATGARLCDITQPGGYCTIFNCEPGTCPEDSVCINFGTTLSAVPGCAPSQGNSPYQRSFCMATCGSNSDCRGGQYSCVNLSGAPDHPNSLGAVLAENSGSGTVCAVTPAQKPPDDQPHDVCTGSDAGPPEQAVAGAGGGGASGGGASSGGASGDAGDGGAGG